MNGDLEQRADAPLRLPAVRRLAPLAWLAALACTLPDPIQDPSDDVASEDVAVVDPADVQSPQDLPQPPDAPAPEDAQDVPDLQDPPDASDTRGAEDVTPRLEVVDTADVEVLEAADIPDVTEPPEVAETAELPLADDPMEPEDVPETGISDEDTSPCEVLGTEECNGVDDDCDGVVDEDQPDNDLDDDADCTDPDDDNDGVLDADDNCPRIANGDQSNRDGDTSGDACDDDDDGDGTLDGDDCAPLDANIHPGQSESRCDGKDDNCNEKVDEGFVTPFPALAVGAPCSMAVLECDSLPGTVTCREDQTAAECKPDQFIGAESCDGVDNDCDGSTDEGPEGQALTRPCDDGTAVAPGVGACRLGVNVCTDGSYSAVCEGTVGPLPETCNGVDDDCDGATDEGHTWAGLDIGDTCQVGDCANGTVVCLTADTATCSPLAATFEGHFAGETCGAVGICSEGVVELDCTQLPAVARCSTRVGGSASEAKAEACNQVDDDCDGQTDEDFVLGALCTDGLTCGVGRTGCGSGGGLECVPEEAGAQGLAASLWDCESETACSYGECSGGACTEAVAAVFLKDYQHDLGLPSAKLFIDGILPLREGRDGFRVAGVKWVDGVPESYVVQIEADGSYGSPALIPVATKPFYASFIKARQDGTLALAGARLVAWDGTADKPGARIVALGTTEITLPLDGVALVGFERAGTGFRALVEASDGTVSVVPVSDLGNELVADPKIVIPGAICRKTEFTRTCALAAGPAGHLAVAASGTDAAVVRWVQHDGTLGYSETLPKLTLFDAAAHPSGFVAVGQHTDPSLSFAEIVIVSADASQRVPLPQFASMGRFPAVASVGADLLVSSIAGTSVAKLTPGGVVLWTKSFGDQGCETIDLAGLGDYGFVVNHRCPMGIVRATAWGTTDCGSDCATRSLATCDDKDPSTLDGCTGDTCTHAAAACFDGNECTGDGGNAGNCHNEPVLDGTACGARGTCQAGTCVGVVNMDVGWNHTCVLRTDGQVLCWGRSDAWSDQQPSPISAGLFPSVHRMSATGFGYCVHRDDGNTTCVGDCRYGLCGAEPPPVGTPPIGTISTVDATGPVECGYVHCCFPKDPSVWCWGYETSGNTSLWTSPVEMVGTSDPHAIGPGGYGTCMALGANRELWCLGTTALHGGTTSLVPVRVQDGAGNPKNITQITALKIDPSAHACALTSVGEVWCWGVGDKGQLDGTPTAAEFQTPRRVGGAGTPAFSKVEVGAGFTCALTAASGEVWCWGTNTGGQLGRGTFAPGSAPGLVPGLTGIEELALYDRHACARRGSQVWCWGKNDDGQLGDGTFEDRPSPVQVLGLIP